MFSWRAWRLGIALGLVASSLALAGPFDASLETLENAMQKEQAEKEKKAEGKDREPAYYRSEVGPGLVARIRTVIGQGEPRQIDEILNQCLGYYQSGAVKKAVAQLRKEVNADQAKREQEFLAEMKAAIDAGRKAVKTAKDAGDLDAALQKLNGVVRDRYGSGQGESIRNQTEKTRQARQFVIHWQNYLVAVETGNRDDERSSLRYVSDMEDGLLPRSEVLALLSKIPDENRSSRNEPVDAPKLTEVVGKTIPLAKVPATLETLRRFFDQSRRNYRSVTSFEVLRRELTELQLTYDRFQAGLPAKFEVGADSNGGNVSDEANPLILPAKIELMRIVFPVYLGSSEKPKPDETIQAYLDRIMAEAAPKLDVATMQKVIDLQMALEANSAGRPWNSFQSLMVARNQEEAGQYALAVLSYQSALKTGGDDIPAKAVGERLKAIEAAHPEEYKAGMEKALAGVNAPPYSYSRSFNGTVVIPGRVDEPAKK